MRAGRSARIKLDNQRGLTLHRDLLPLRQLANPDAPGLQAGRRGKRMYRMAAGGGSSLRTGDFWCMLLEQTTEGIPVKMLRMVPVLIAALVLFSARSAAAQAQSTAVGCNYHCYRVALPLGLAIREVTDDGSFVTLEDGSVWEIRLPQRPVASSWQPGDFVQLTTVWAPVDRFETLLAHGDTDRAEARLAGRKQLAGARGQQ